MWKKNLIYRDNLEASEDITFGIEIEFDKARKIAIKNSLDKAYDKKDIFSRWEVKNDETVYCGTTISSPRGGEVVSDVLKDSSTSWNDIKYVCEKIKDYGGVATYRCGAHVHIGADIMKKNMLYYERLIKLWTVYEGIILRFCYGEDNYPRKYMSIFAASPYHIVKKIFNYSYDFKTKRLKMNFDEFMKTVRGPLGLKNLSLTFKGIDNDFLKLKYRDSDDWFNHRTLEFRAGNGTLDSSIWQNYVNLYMKIVLCCLDDTKNWDMIDKKFDMALRWEPSLMYDCDKANEFCNFVFNNEVDEYNFMVQYIKDKNCDICRPKIKRRVEKRN